MCKRGKSELRLRFSECYNGEEILVFTSKKTVFSLKPGRPKKEYSKIAERTKRRRKVEIRKNFTQEELRDAVFKKKENVNNDAKHAEVLRNKALALYMDLEMTQKNI